MRYSIAVDTGGTFIDVVVRDEDNNHYVGKALTTHHRVFEGMQEALEYIAGGLGATAKTLLASTDLFIYGTTRATNAIVTRRVAKTALLTTEGFPEILVLKEGGKRDVFDYSTEYPEPYIPRRRTFEVPERVTSEAQIDKPLDEEAVRAILHTLREEDYEAVAVSLLWSIVEPGHELRIGELIEEILPGVPYTLSHQIAPIVREYRRTSATAIDASLKPLMQSHFRELESDLRAFGYAGQLLVSSSIGGVMTVDEMICAPINAAKSGPAMAPVAAINYSEAEGFGGNTIVCDTGGTTFDVGLSHDSALIYTRETWLGGEWEGDLLGISSVDIRSIGSGGGSIAWVDDGGLLRVGPQSAGSEPGPACYGRGGTEATLSDAACVLGFFDPAYFLGGRMELDTTAAHTAVSTVAQKLGMSVEETAWGILILATDHMIKAVYDMTISQGLDPKESTVVAGGGAAGINILQIAADLGSSHVVLPKTAGALSAAGMHFADILKEESSPLITRGSTFDVQRVNSALEILRSKLAAFAGRVGLKEDDYSIEYFTEARYEAQVWDVVTPVPVGEFRTEEDIAQLRKAFDTEHERLFAFHDDTADVEFISWKARLTADLHTSPMHSQTVARTISSPSKSRSCYFGPAGRTDTPVYLPKDLDPGQYVAGPAIIQEPTTTLVVYPGQAAEVSGAGNYILHVQTLEEVK